MAVNEGKVSIHESEVLHYSLRPLLGCHVFSFKDLPAWPLEQAGDVGFLCAIVQSFG